MIEAGLIANLFQHFIDHPGMIIWFLLYGFIQRLLCYKTYMAHSLTIFLAVGLATLILWLISPSMYESFLAYFTDLKLIGK